MNQPPDSATPTRPRTSRRQALGCLVLCGALGAVVLGVVSVLPAGPQHTLIQETLLRVVRAKTHREVSCGPVSGNLWRGVRVERFVVAGPQGLGPRREPAISVDELRLRWHLLAALWSADPLAGLASVEVRNPQAVLTRGTDGKLDLVELFRLPKKEKKDKGPLKFAGRVQVTGGVLVFVDRKSGAAPLKLNELGVDVNFSRRFRAHVVATARSPEALGWFALDGHLRLEPRVSFTGGYTLNGLRLARLAPYVDRPLLHLDGGEVSTAGDFHFKLPAAHSHERVEAGCNLSATFADCGLRLRMLGRPLRHLNGQVTVRQDSLDPRRPSPHDAIELHDLEVEAGRSHVRLDGAVKSPRKPVFALRVRSDHWYGGELGALLPWIPALRHMVGERPARVDATFSGPLNAWRVGGWVEPHGLGWADEGRLEGGRLAIDLRAHPTGLRIAGAVTLAGVEARTRWLGQVISGLNGRIAFVDDTLMLTRLSGRSGGTSLFVDGRLAHLLRRDALSLDLVTRSNQVNPLILAKVLPRAVAPRSARGGMAGEVRVVGPLRALAIRGHVKLPWLDTPSGALTGGSTSFDLVAGVRRQPSGWVQLNNLGVVAAKLGVPITELDGKLTLAGGQLACQGLRLRYGGDPLAIAGSAALSGQRLDLRVQTPGLDVGRLAALLHEPVAGRLAADLRVAGDRSQLNVSGTTAVEFLRARGVALRGARLAANLTVRPSAGLGGLDGRLLVTDAEAQGGPLPAPVRLDRADVRLAHGQAEIVGVTGTLDGDPLSVKGRIADLPHRAGLALAVEVGRLRHETLRRLAPDAPVHLDRPLAAALKVTGRWPQPRLTGRLSAPGLELTGKQSLRLAGGLDLDVTLTGKHGPGVPATGTIALREVTLTPRSLGLPARAVNGVVRLTADQRLVVVSPKTLQDRGELVGQLGGSSFALTGTLDLSGPELTPDLTLTATNLSLADVRTALEPLGSMPRLEGDGQFTGLAIRAVGPLSHLQVSSVAEPNGEIGLPAALEFSGYRLNHGRARLAVVVSGADLTEGTIVLSGGELEGDTTPRIHVTRALLNLDAGRLKLARLDAEGAGGALQVAAQDLSTAPPDPLRPVAPAPSGYAARVRLKRVVLGSLVPKQSKQLARYADLRISSELTVVGPPENLVVAGQVSLEPGEPDAVPLTAQVRVRLVTAGDTPAQLFGRATFQNGELALPELGQPLRGLSGQLDFDQARVGIALRAKLGQTAVRVAGSVCGLASPGYDLTVDLDGIDLAGALDGLRLPAADGHGTTDVWTRCGLPRLLTPAGGTATLTLKGAAERVVLGLTARLPQLALDPSQALDDPDRPEGEGAPVTLARDLGLSGSAVGALTAPLPGPAAAAAAVQQLAAPSATAPEAPAASAAPPAGSLLDRFSLHLSADTQSLAARQALACLPAASRKRLLGGPLGQTFVHQPGQLHVEVDGPATAPRATANVALARVAVNGVPVRRVSAKIEVDKQQLICRAAEVELHGGSVHAQGGVLFGPSADTQAQVHLNSVDLAVLPALGLVGVPLGGLADGDVSWHQYGTNRRATGYLQLRSLTARSQSLGHGWLDFGLVDSTLTLRKAILYDPVTHALCRLRGDLGLGEEGRLNLAAEVRSLELSRLTPLLGQSASTAVSGRLDFTGGVLGTRRLPLVQGVGNVFFGSLAGLPFNRVTLRAQPRGANSLAVHLELSDPAYQATAQATLSHMDFASGSADWRVEASLGSVDVAQALPLLGQPTLGNSSGGTITGRANLAGRLARGGAQASLWNDLRGSAEFDSGPRQALGGLQVGGLPLSRARFKLAADGRNLRLEEFALATGRTELNLAAGLDSGVSGLGGKPRLDVHLVTPALHYADLLPVTRLPLATAGSLSARVDVTGAASDPQALLTVGTAGFSLAGAALGEQTIEVKLSRAGAELAKPLELALAGARLSLAGGYGRERVRAQASLAIDDFRELRRFAVALATPPERLSARPWQAALLADVASLPDPLDGRLEARLELDGPRAAPAGWLELRTAGLHSLRRPLPDVVVALGLEQDARRLGAIGPGTLALTGRVARPADGSTRLALKLALDDLSLHPYEAWRPTTLDRLRGRLEHLEGTVDGPLSAPVWRIREASLAGFGVGDPFFSEVRLTDVSGRRGTLTLGGVEVKQQSLEVKLRDCSLPLDTVDGQLKLSATRDLRVKGYAQVGDLSDFAPLFGSVGALEGNALLELDLRGSQSKPVLDDLRLAVDLPQLQVVDRKHKTLAVDFDPLAPTPKAAALDRTDEVLLLRGGSVRIEGRGQRIVVNECRGELAPPATAAPAGKLAPVSAPGRLWVEPGSSLELQHLEKSKLLLNPVDGALLAEGLNATLRSVALRDLNLRLTLDSGHGTHPNQLQFERCQGWVNSGLVQVRGGVAVNPRYAALTDWANQVIDISVLTPPVLAGTLKPAQLPPGAQTRLAPALLLAEEKLVAAKDQPYVVYPVVYNQPSTVGTSLMPDLHLHGSPLRLEGVVGLGPTLVREGILASGAGTETRTKAEWPSLPTLNIRVKSVEKGNVLQTRVPEIRLPWSVDALISGTPRRLSVEGDVDVTQGKVYASVLKYQLQVQDGRAHFAAVRNPHTGSFETNTRFEARAATSLPADKTRGAPDGYHVDLRITGRTHPGSDGATETELNVTGSSDPPLPEQELLSRLTTKSEFAEAVAKGSIDELVKKEAADLAFGQAISYFAPVFAEIAKAFGLDEFILRYQMNQPIEMNLGKYVVRNLFIGMTMVVGERGENRQTFRVRYDMRPWPLRFGGTVDSRSDFGVTTEWQKGF